MLSNFSLGPPIDGMGLFHGLGTYCGKFTISVSACREMMPDPAFYAQCLESSYSEMLSATNKLIEQKVTPINSARTVKKASKKKAKKRASKKVTTKSKNKATKKTAKKSAKK